MIGETVDRKYKLLRLLGEGGMGSVYEAEHTGSHRRVAVKLIKADRLVQGRDAASRFRREARAAAAVESPHIVRVIDSGMDDETGNLYLVMEYLVGEDLQRLLDQAGPLSPDVALRIAGQALSGLTQAHAASIIHRDIKPANLFLSRGSDGSVTVKILDFGIAKVRSDSLQGPHTTGLTESGGFLGSPLYMSPEQVQSSKDVDVRADVWSLGCTLYAALAGRAPHQDIASVGRLIVAICGTPAPALREHAPWVSPEIEALVHRALDIDPARRTPSAAAMLDEVRALVPGGFLLQREMLVGILPSAPVRERGAGDTAVSSTLPLPVATTSSASGERSTDDSVAPSPGPLASSEPRPTAPPASSWRWATAAAAALVAVLGARALVQRDRAPDRPPVPVASVSVSVEQPVETVRRMALEVSPTDAMVEIDGVGAAIRDGRVEIEGRLGSVHRVHLQRDLVERTAEVTISEKGLIPPRLDLPSAQEPAKSAVLSRTAKPSPPRSSAPPEPRPPAAPTSPQSPPDDVLRPRAPP